MRSHWKGERPCRSSSAERKEDRHLLGCECAPWSRMENLWVRYESMRSIRCPHLLTVCARLGEWAVVIHEKEGITATKGGV